MRLTRFFGFHVSLLSKMGPKYVTIVERGMMLELIRSRMFLVHLVYFQKCIAEHLLRENFNQFFSLLIHC